MTIGIDARFYGPLGKGLGRYTQEVVDNILQISSATTDVSFDYVVFLSPENYDEFSSSNPRVRKIKTEVRWYSWAEQLRLPFLIKREKVDLMHFPHFNVPIIAPTKFVVTIHDLILTNFPTLRATTLSPWLYYLKNLAYRLVISTAVRRAEKIITVSEFTKRNLVEKFRVRPEKIIVTYEGVADLGKSDEISSSGSKQDVLSRYQLTGDFLLYVGNAYPHKNLEWLLRAFKRLREKEKACRLVLVGKEDYFYRRVEKEARSLDLWQPGREDSAVVLAGYVPDNQLGSLYQAARAYIFPSLYEGFGLPPLEAMSRHCPVLSSDRSSLPEILGESALYFNPEDEDDFLDKAGRIMHNEDLRSNLISRGLAQAEKYSWVKCARETFAVYRAALKI